MLNAMTKRLKRLFAMDRSTEEEPWGYNGMTYEELAELYKSRGWPPPDKEGYIKYP